MVIVDTQSSEQWGQARRFLWYLKVAICGRENAEGPECVDLVVRLHILDVHGLQ